MVETFDTARPIETLETVRMLETADQFNTGQTLLTVSDSSRDV
jgi:hypothetical protein